MQNAQSNPNMQHIVVAGNGIMGNAIAMIFIRHGYCVSLYGRREESLQASRAFITRGMQESAQKGECTREEAEMALACLRCTTGQACFSNCDFVMENITEDIRAKHAFYREISTLVPKEAILASNTSGLSINAIAEAVRDKSRFLGINWYNPAHLVPLVEITRGDETALDTVHKAYALMQAIGKQPVIVQRDIPGFIGNRLQFAVLREALSLVEQGVASIEDVDRVMKYGLGFRYAVLGPLEVADLGGLDTFYRITEALNPVLCDEKQPSSAIRQLFENGDFGVKTGKGFYDYSEGKAEQAVRKRDEAFVKLSKALFS